MINSRRYFLFVVSMTIASGACGHNEEADPLRPTPSSISISPIETTASTSTAPRHVPIATPELSALAIEKLGLEHISPRIVPTGLTKLAVSTLSGTDFPRDVEAVSIQIGTQTDEPRPMSIGGAVAVAEVAVPAGGIRYRFLILQRDHPIPFTLPSDGTFLFLAVAVDLSVSVTNSETPGILSPTSRTTLFLGSGASDLGRSDEPAMGQEGVVSGPGPISYTASGRLAILDASKSRAIWADNGGLAATFSTPFLPTDPILVDGFVITDKGAAYSTGTTLALGFRTPTTLDLTGWTPGNYSLAPLDWFGGAVLTTTLDGRILPLVNDDGRTATDSLGDFRSSHVPLNELLDSSVYVASPFLGRIESDSELYPLPDVSRQTLEAAVIVLADQDNDLWVIRADKSGISASRVLLEEFLPVERPRALGNTPTYAISPDLGELSVLICGDDQCDLLTFSLATVKGS